MVTSSIFNISAAANGFLDSAKDRLTRLTLAAESPVNGVNPASIEKAEAALEFAKEADKALSEFATMNGFSLS